MACDTPLTAYYGAEVNPRTGKRPMVFDIRRAHSPTPVKLPCGQCMGCRLEHSRQWAMRGVHEKQLHAFNAFVTLTYDDKHLPKGKTLVREHPQLLLKRMRTELAPLRFRFYGCGEYGEKTLRPHYHLILFGLDFPDKQYYKTTESGEKLYTSAWLQDKWSYGFNVIGDVTFQSIAYVARYVTVKIKGDMADKHYGGRLPEFPMYSRRPGIGAGWFDKFGAHAYEWDSVIMNGKEVKPPRFYDGRYELIDADRLALLKLARRRKIVRSEQTSSRRHTKEDLLRLNLKAMHKEL